MLGLIAGFRASRVIHVAARLRLANALREGPMDVPALAAATLTHGPSLERLLRALASLGVLAQRDDGRFALTPLGATLDDGAARSLRAWAEAALGGEHYAAWGELEFAVRHGKVAFDHLYGMNVWAFRQQAPERGRAFDEAMAALATGFDENLLAHPAFARARQLVDVGGGDASVLIGLLQRHPALRGILLERPDVAAGARLRVHDAGLADRCEVVAGDAFTAVPSNADGYLLCRFLHDWDDAPARDVLQNCRHAIAPGGRLLVIERLLPERFDVSPPAQTAALADLAMLVMTGGRERTAGAYETLLADAGFRMIDVEPMPSGLALIQAEPAANTGAPDPGTAPPKRDARRAAQ